MTVQNMIPTAQDREGWFKSSYSAGTGGDCIEVKVRTPQNLAVRDSKVPNGPRLELSAAALSSFVSAVKTGDV